jgi:tetratricopeptide (TPR) repeat protein
MMASKSRKKTGGSKSSRGSSVASGTLIASIIAAFLVGYVVSAFVGGFRLNRDFSGGGSAMFSDGTLFEQAPSRGEYIEMLKERVSEAPKDQDLWTELGNAYFDNDQYGDAIAAYQRSLELDSGNANVWTDMGIMYRRIGEYSEALSAFERAIAEDPAHQMSRFNRGVVLFYDLEDRIGAFQSWDELAEMNPNFRIPDGRTIVQMLRDLR